jgi:hypothetical protein
MIAAGFSLHPQQPWHVKSGEWPDHTQCGL